MKRTIRGLALMACILMLCAALASCWFMPGSHRSGLRGLGGMVEKTFSVQGFTRLQVDGQAKLVYQCGEEESLRVEMQQNILDEFLYEVQGDTLVLKWDRTIISVGKNVPVLYVTSPTLTAIDVAGAVTMEPGGTIAGDSLELNVAGACDISLDMDVQQFAATISGAGKMALSGTAPDAEITINGAGTVEALELQTQNAQATINGAGSCKIACSDNLDATINGVGSLRYKGSPSVRPTVAGAGSIKSVDED